MRKLVIDAAKGERSAQKLFFARVEAAQERRHSEKTMRFGLLTHYVTEQATSRTTASAAGAAEVWPHPDDVLLDYINCLGVIAGLHATTSAQLPPSFKARLDWDTDKVPVGALEVETLDGHRADFTLLASEGDDTAWCLFQFNAEAQSASSDIPRRARLSIAAKTASVIDRLQIERQNRATGMTLAPTVPDFSEFHGSFTEGPGVAGDMAT